ncbi:hypothetical protein ACF05T_32340 [Streptomyces lateritius]|uniref:Uncharacterized protein n=1 Tax=Streptomyces lateritius TaxID=67313 RepID=A0ABW6YLF8_9ACTN
METVPLLLRGQWEKELETIFLNDLELAWGPRIRPVSKLAIAWDLERAWADVSLVARPKALPGEQPGTTSGPGRVILSGPAVVPSAEIERLLSEAGRGRAGQGRQRCAVLARGLPAPRHGSVREPDPRRR